MLHSYWLSIFKAIKIVKYNIHTKMYMSFKEGSWTNCENGSFRFYIMWEYSLYRASEMFWFYSACLALFWWEMEWANIMLPSHFNKFIIPCQNLVSYIDSAPGNQFQAATEKMYSHIIQCHRNLAQAKNQKTSKMTHFCKSTSRALYKVRLWEQHFLICLISRFSLYHK